MIVHVLVQAEHLKLGEGEGQLNLVGNFNLPSHSLLFLEILIEIYKNWGIALMPRAVAIHGGGPLAKVERGSPS